MKHLPVLLALVILPLIALGLDTSAATAPLRPDSIVCHTPADMFARITDRRIHCLGNLFAKIANDGSFGGDEGVSQTSPEWTYIGHRAPSFEYPAFSRGAHLFNGSLWVGGIIGGDTLVSTAVLPWSNSAREFNGYSAIEDTSDPVKMRQSFQCIYFDTLVRTDTYDEGLVPRLHKPLGLKITQRSHIFTAAPYNRFVLIEYAVTNIGSTPISAARLGHFADPDLYNESLDQLNPAEDDVAGYLDDACIAYAMDNDGDPSGTAWNSQSLRSAFAMAPLALDPPATDTSFNWLATDFELVTFGPAKADANPALGGFPYGDVLRYAMMSNAEIDYDQIFSAVDHSAAGWYPPISYDLVSARNVANGLDTRILLCFGPYDLAVGDSIQFAMAILPGDSIHVSPTDYQTHFDPSNPQVYRDHLDFSDLRENVRLARKVYENGLRLPALPPIDFTVSLLSDSIVGCWWNESRSEGISGFRLYRRDLTFNLPWAVVSSGGPEWFGTEDAAVTIGHRYGYAIAALDSVGYEGPKSPTLEVTPGKPAVRPELTLSVVLGAIRLDWTIHPAGSAFSPPRYVNLYRRLYSEPWYDATLIGKFEYVDQQIRPAGSHPTNTPASAGVFPAPRGDLVKLIPPYDDRSAIPGWPYFYSASITNAIGVEGDRSLEVSGVLTSSSNPVDVSSRMINWLYGRGPTTPDTNWDVNADGVIDIRDVVESLSK